MITSITMLFIVIISFLLLIFKSFMRITLTHKLFINFFQFSRTLFFPSIKTIITSPKEGNISLLDLPDLPLENILKKLSPAELCKISRVCSSLRDICRSDHLWENHMNKKWGGIIGDSAYKEWEFRLASKEMKERLKSDLRRSLPVNSVMFFYLALESGKFWFPAQVFNREVQHGHIGFMLSCYDAKLSYDLTTDNFVARYPGHGRHMIEGDIEWNRIRAQNIDTPANVLHSSDCLDELKPDDHIEIQWRRNEEFPYDVRQVHFYKNEASWCYGVVGHLESCEGNEVNCQCHISDTVILEFKQYDIESRWRKMTIGRKEYRENGNKADGFYGGIRKIYKEDDIARWEHLCPNCILE
ncbi:hypothetical protein BUALT_Bualt16G0112700 [Buddleja alternifolia]|uniref:F-box domain-containing protein n=1 Tax=Buddleja alternifolia TaxID=168488 RepID=A0AAV6WLM6_9LAMI|nr:hypothetical protein BUALT_Bualt16G0112700 [Buddleja alternifolia]